MLRLLRAGLAIVVGVLQKQTALVARGNYGDAAVSLAAMVPVLGAAATAGKLGTKAAKMAGKVAGKVDEAAAGIKQGISKMQDACKGSRTWR